MLAKWRTLRRISRFILSGIVSIHTYWRAGQIGGIFRNYWGHKSSKTKEIYIHMSNKDIGRVKSPLDSLQIKGGEDD